MFIFISLLNQGFLHTNYFKYNENEHHGILYSLMFIYSYLFDDGRSYERKACSYVE